MLHIPALWYFGISVICTHRFRRVRLVIIPPCFVWQQYLWNIALQPSVGCYKAWVNSRYKGCSPLGENHCEVGLFSMSLHYAHSTHVTDYTVLASKVWLTETRYSNFSFKVIWFTNILVRSFESRLYFTGDAPKLWCHLQNMNVVTIEPQCFDYFE